MLCARCREALDAGLTFTDTPPRAYYEGQAIDLPAGQLALLCRLAERGHAPFHRLNASRESLRVQIHNLRARLPAGIAIVPVKGWGYELRVS